MLVNTSLFQQEANNFLREGFYCGYPSGTYSHREYWTKMQEYCINGIKIADLWIPGPYFFYLNFIQILAKDEVTGRKTLRFPRFTDVDLDYFLNIHKARKEGKGIAILKPRRTGMTYKSAILCVHEYIFYRSSRTIIGAFQSSLSDQAMSYIIDAFNHLDKHTEWRRQRNPDTRSFVKARFKETADGKEVWSGYQSEIHAISFKDNPFAAIGKTASLFILDEVGKFPGLINSYNISEPCWKDGDSMIGIPILQGTGGDMEGGTADFYELFYNPDKYNLLTFKNDYDEGRDGANCGWFIPASRMRFGTLKDEKGKEVLSNGSPIQMVDDDGNSNIAAGVESILNFRKLKAKGNNNTAINDAVTQYPLTPGDAFLRSKGNNFPTAELNYRLGELETTEKYKNAEYIGELILNSETGGVEWKLNPKLEPIRRFPLKHEDNKSGAVIIYEMPFKNSVDETPPGLFIGGIDTFDHTISTTDSLGSILIYNKLNKRIVAEYTGRPDEDNRFYETCRRLLMFYNGCALYENMWKGLFTYFEHKHSVHLLAQQPKVLKDVVLEQSVNRVYGAHLTKEIKPWADNLIRLWLCEDYDETNPGVLNLHKLRSVPLIQELIAYTPDGNFDRVDAMKQLMILIEETRSIDAGQLVDRKLIPIWESDFFKKPIYTRNRLSYNLPS